MRPHQLEISAFGPFAGTVSVDLDDLGSAGLLLLHGETGAGKTSVLDAIGYALYGAVPGERGIRGLRSEHAEGAVETWVRLTFSAGGRRLRIRRSPEQTVAKQRGTGSTTKRASALLEELAPDGTAVVLATRLDEAGLFIGDLVGMNATQFFQVVLLPQGRFAAFLQAPAKDRQALLQQLFDTSRFADVEAALKSRRDALRGEVGAAAAEGAAAAAVLARLAGVDAPPVDGVADWARGRLVAMAAAAETAEALAEQAEAAEAVAREQAELTGRLADLRRRQLALLTRRAALEAAQEQADELRARLTRARTAAPLAPDLQRLVERRAQRPGLEAGRQAAATALAEALTGCPGLVSVSERAARSGPAAVERAAAELVAALGPMAVLEAELASREQALAAAGREVQAAEERRVAAEGALESARQRVVILTAGLAADEVRLAGLPALTAAAAAARARAEAVVLLPAGEQASLAAQQTLTGAREHAVEARERWLDLRDRRLQGMAAELAAGLTVGEACVVCGSCDHPAPAARTAEGVSEADERAAHEAVEAAEITLEPLRSRVTEAAAALAELRARAAASAGDPVELAAALAETLAVAAALPSRQAALAQAEADLATAESDVATTELALVAARAAAATRSGSLDEQRGQVVAARAGAPSVAVRLEQLAAIARAADEAASAAQALRLADERTAALDAELADAAATAGFDGVEQVAAAVLTPEQVDEAERLLRSHDDEAAAVRDGLDDPDVAGEPHADVDLIAARAAADDARAVLAAAYSERAAVGAQVEQAQPLVGRIERLSAELAPRQAELAEVSALAELAAGGAGNRLRMSLTSYVLAARLEQVAARASVRLAHMTSGRFTLVHSDEVVDGRSQSGLGLAVQDVWTGTQRPTSSLSGGESFMTALSLALGLADVVAEEAGGRRIDTLFVDEGFGSLDEAALDRVMDVLDTLRDGGRLVGVVSHVEELQRRVPARLEVMRTERGSWLRPHHAPAEA